MTLQAPMRCSALAEQLDEPIAGTVDQRARWLLLEDRSPWGSKAVEDLFGADAAARAKTLRLRLLLVRRREGDPADDVRRRAILVDTVTREMAMRSVGGPGDLSVDEAAAMPLDAFGDPLPAPLFLACTNGKRDACCALRGRATVTAMVGFDVWECTHLGGHRFAGNLVCLPDGLVYGRVGPTDGPRLAAGYLEGRVDPAFMRGRSAWPAPAQVAEVELRSRFGLTGLDDVGLGEVAVAGDAASVTLVAGGDQHRLQLVREAASPPRPTSCRGDEVEEPLHWRAVERS